MDIRIESLAKSIFDEIDNWSKKMKVVVPNRFISFDFAKIFNATTMDYSADCVLVEKLFLQENCKKIKVNIEKPKKEADEIRKQIIKLCEEIDMKKAGEKNFTKTFDTIEQLEKRFKEIGTETVLTDVSVHPYSLDETEYFIVDKINSITKPIYKSFCYQIATFVFNYYSTMRMTTLEFYDIEVFSVKNVDSIDIVCRMINKKE